MKNGFEMIVDRCGVGETLGEFKTRLDLATIEAQLKARKVVGGDDSEDEEEDAREKGGVVGKRLL